MLIDFQVFAPMERELNSQQNPHNISHLILTLVSNYTVSQKNIPYCNCPHLLQILTNFEISFTGTLLEQLAIKWLLNVSPHHNCISTLPREI